MIDGLVGCFAMFRIAWLHSKGKLLFSTAATLASGAAWPLVALALKSATNAVIARDVRAAGASGIVIGAGAVGVLILSHFAFWPYTEIAESAQISLEAELMSLANGSAGLEHHDRPDCADTFELLKKEIARIGAGFTGLFNVLALLISISVTGVLLAQVNPLLLLLPIAAIPPIWTGQHSQRVLQRSREETGSAARQAEHLFHLATEVGPAKELRIFRLQSEMLRRHTVLWDDMGRKLWAAEKRAALARAGGQVVFAVAYVASVLVVLRQTINGRSTVGDIMLVITLAAQVNQQVNSGLQLLQQLQRMAQAMTRLRWMRELIRSQQPQTPDRPAPEQITSGIELRGVEFVYPGTQKSILGNFDVLLPAGSIVALVGENGAGKSTLVKLLCRFYEATSGEILLDGVDIRRFAIADWRERISAGFQDFARLEVVARETVGVGDLPRIESEDSVLAALDRAGAADVVSQLDDGLDTQLGKSYTEGTELSGGQWQKLALGRAMMRDRPLVLILDEPTSALDAEAEHALFEQYAQNARRIGRETGAITVLVSHRFSTVRMADQIIVVGDGGIIETGTHAELMSKLGVYSELYGLQAASYQ